MRSSVVTTSARSFEKSSCFGSSPPSPRSFSISPATMGRIFSTSDAGKSPISLSEPTNMSTLPIANAITPLTSFWWNARSRIFT